MLPQITQKHSKLYVFSLETLKNTLFDFDCFSGGNESSKNVSVKTMPKPYTNRTDQRVYSKMCHLGIPAVQTRSVKLGIKRHADYMFC